jgi:hypothetical protein
MESEKEAHLCEKCGAIVWNKTLHEEYHEEIGKYQRYVNLFRPKPRPHRNAGG